MFVQGMIFDVTPLGEFSLANRANISMLLLSMLFHIEETVALEVANLALKLDNSRVDTFVRGHLKRGSACDDFAFKWQTEVSLVKSSSQKWQG